MWTVYHLLKCWPNCWDHINFLQFACTIDVREYDLLCVNVQDLGSSFLLRQTNLDLDLQPAGSQQGVVHHVPPALFCVCVLSLKKSPLWFYVTHHHIDECTYWSFR